MKLYTPIFLALLGLSACVPGSSGSNQIQQALDPLITEATRINNAGLEDLKRIEAIAQVPNPNLPGGIEDLHGLQCARAGEQVLTIVQGVQLAAGKNPGPLAVGEMGTFLIPNTPQFNDARDTLNSGCLLKAQDVLGGPARVALAGGVVAAMVNAPAILPLVGG